MRAVDTNIVVRLIARDDPEQVAAAESFVKKGAWVSHLALAEVMWVLSAVYDRDAAGVGTAVEMLLDHKQLVLQDPDVVSAALEHFRKPRRKRSAVEFTDCLMLEISRKAGHLPLGTFDGNLGKLPGTERPGAGSPGDEA